MYAEEKLISIIKYLATAEGDLRLRIAHVSRDIVVLKENDFPEELKCVWRKILNDLTKYPPQYNWNGTELQKGSIEHTMSRIRNVTASRIATRIFTLFEELQSYK